MLPTFPTVMVLTVGSESDEFELEESCVCALTASNSAVKALMRALILVYGQYR